MENNITNPQTPYPWATPSPTSGQVLGATQTTQQVSSPDPWNYGYTHSTGTAPYSGDALAQFQAGQAAYQADYARTHQTTGSGPVPQPGPAPSQPPAPSGSSGPSAADIYRQQMEGQINGGYNDYFNTLDQMMNNGLPAQQTAQNNIAQNSYNTSVADLGYQKTDSQNQLDIQSNKTVGNQVKTLKDISSNIRNLMQGANNYLGALGAGDSSAANQYAYALTKVGSEQFGNVKSQTASILQDINDKSTQVNNIFMQEKNKLQGELNNAVQGIAQWFSTAQQQLLQAKAQGQLSKSQDLQSLTTNMYNQAVQAMQNLQTQAAQKQSTLETWAANNATNINQLKQNMSQVAQYSAANPTFDLSGATPSQTPTGKSGATYGGYSGSSEDQLKKLLG